MKNGLLALMLLTTTGCATLLNRGVVTPEDIAAACKDIVATCAVTENLDAQAKVVCERLVPLCTLPVQE